MADSNPKSDQLNVNAEMLVGLATVPVLVGLVVARAVNGVLLSVGEASEELFRGSRLPVLHFKPSDADKPV
ncbi:hypothetical protein ACQ4M4_23225 [Leptolyngbya sp. AN02str]|uniref:hypothetical protein n=1 Tax=Leptolyngbya sp. AN02str TaxID=3423363 RepID=UPI003D317B95